MRGYRLGLRAPIQKRHAPARQNDRAAEAGPTDRAPPAHALHFALADIPLRAPASEQSEAGRKDDGRTGLPGRLKAGIESLSGLAMDDVRVHYNSPKPATIGAAAYTRGTQIYMAPGQEGHLGHEAWHVVQQKRGQVRPTMRQGGLPINDESALERDADRQGSRAAAAPIPEPAGTGPAGPKPTPAGIGSTVQCVSTKNKGGNQTNTSKNKKKAKKNKKKAKTSFSYSQKDDPTLRHYIPLKRRIIGQRAVEMLTAGNEPSAEDVRVPATTFAGTVMGQGLHEGLPTSERRRIAKIAFAKLRKRLAQIQSGIRTTPALTVLRTPSGQIAGHTGTFVAPHNPHASLGTSGQAAAHDGLRTDLAQVIQNNDPEVAHIDLLNAHIASVATGPQILAAPHLANLPPNLTAAANTAALAEVVHNRREETKSRTRALKRSLPPSAQSRTRSPSPPRRPLHQGGQYSGQQPVLPQIPEVPEEDEIAHLTAWATQPLRLEQ